MPRRISACRPASAGRRLGRRRLGEELAHREDLRCPAVGLALERPEREPGVERVPARLGLGAAHAREPAGRFLAKRLLSCRPRLAHSRSNPLPILTIASPICHSTVRMLMSSRSAISLSGKSLEAMEEEHLAHPRRQAGNRILIAPPHLLQLYRLTLLGGDSEPGLVVDGDMRRPRPSPPEAVGEEVLDDPVEEGAGVADPAGGIGAKQPGEGVVK